MFVVHPLYCFAEDARAFTDMEELREVVAGRGLEVNNSMCADCPPMSSTMAVPHIFAHVYAGLEMLNRGQEEWQMCQIVHKFMKENQEEMKCDTEEYFSSLPRKQTVAHYVWSLSQNFQQFDAAQVYLFARACNSHTRVHFSNYVWSTIEHKLSHYVALDIAVVGGALMPLCSVDHEAVSCIVGEVQWLVDPVDVKTDKYSDGEDSDVEAALAMDMFDVKADENLWEWHADKMSHDDLSAAQLRTKPCYVPVQRLSVHVCCQLTSPVMVLVECLPRSTLNPTVKFRAADKSRSDQFPGRVFKGTRDWTKCVVPCEKQSILSRMPGFVFSAKNKPREKCSKSSLHPGTVFRSYNVSQPVPKQLDVQLCVKRVSPQHPCRDATVRKFSCLVCNKFLADTRVIVKCHIESEHNMFTCKSAHCIAGFRTECGRDVHAAVHIQKNQGCTRCSQVFLHRFALERHMVIHANARKHRCQQCGHKYFRPQDLKEHVVTAHNALTFHCEVCEYVGQSQRALRQHALVHEPPKLKCVKCGVAFRWCSQWASHSCK